MNKPDPNKPAFNIIPGMKQKVENNKCPTCGKKIIEADFKDRLSKKEYSISGMCQECQDSVFG